MNNLAEQVIIDILKEEMNIDDNHIWIRNQNKKIPPEDGLFVVVGMVYSKTYGAVTQYVPKTITPEEPAEPYEILEQQQSVQTVDSIQIDIVSRDNSAITRRWEVIAALNSLYSEQQQEGDSFKISHIPTNFVNSSSAEGGSNLNRFSIVVNCFVWYKKYKDLVKDNDDGINSYYDSFTTRADDEKTIGTEEPLIEFTLTEEED